MTRQSATIEDELGIGWLVLPGDPAWPACEILLKRMSLIVLPRGAILGKEEEYLPGVRETALARVRAAYDETKSGGIRDAFLRGTRLLACLDMLEEERQR